MRIACVLLAGTLCWAAPVSAQTPLSGRSVVKIVQKSDGYSLVRNGEPYFIKGGSGARSHLEDLISAGGNSVRSFGGTDMLDVAGKQGLTVMVGLSVGNPRHGFDYNDPVRVRKQLEKAVDTVRQFKSHPAVLIWALGNEIEINTTEAERIQLWKAVDELARAVKAEDPDHPVIAVLAGAGSTKLTEIDRYAPSLDAIGINAYGGMLGVPETVAKQGFKRPYIITEFGPRGHWEVERTAWGLPIEDTSTQKADFYLRAYRHAVGNRPQCLGSYVFLWGQKQEKTHTWYGVFLPDGSRTGAVDAMQLAWTGKWPANRCPLINGQIRAQGAHAGSSAYAPGSVVQFAVDVKDPENDPLRITWDLRKDVSDNPSVGGDREPPTPPISGALVRSEAGTAEFRMPAESGNYRVFVYAHDSGRRVATANLPIQVRGAGDVLKRVTFEGSESEHKWSLHELDAKLPADWSGFRYLVVEFKASSPQRFQLRLHTPQGHSSVLLHPFQGAWVRAALNLDWFSKVPSEGHDMASVGNRSRPGYFVSFWGPFKPVNAITGISVAMQDALGRPMLDLRSVRLAKDSPGDAVLESEPLVDPLGQWTRDDWPGKARSLDDLKAAWSAEEQSLKAGDFEYCQYGGYRATKAKATGFFRVEQIDGKWWFVDPDGHLFLSVGADVTQPSLMTLTEGRNKVFAELPPADLLKDVVRADWDRPGASFFSWNLQRRHGPNWYAGWRELMIRRMDSWGLNTIANWSDPKLWDMRRKPYAVPLRSWQTKVSYVGLPDVYSDEFAANVDKAAREQCEPRKNDPYLLGYFVANEPPWQNRESMLVDMILAGPANAIQAEAKRFLAAGDTPEKRKAFIYRAFERYLDVINKAIKKYDPNHLNLGIRFGGMPPVEMLQAARSFDVNSINVYEYVPSREYLEKLYSVTPRPIVIGEFHFGTSGRGLSSSLKQVRDHKERGTAYRYYVENAFAMPALIGAHWFQWMDEPATGRFDGENYNIGFVDVTDRPYADLVEAAKETHRRLRAVHAGTEQPFSTKAAIR